MPYTLRERIGMWLQRFPILHPLLLTPEGYNDGWTPDGRRRYANRLSGHLVMKEHLHADQ